MDSYSQDVCYAFAQLGLDDGASLKDIQNVLRFASTYRFRTKSRTDHVEKFANFFIARAEFGLLGKSFTDIRRVYHRTAMGLHPDRNKRDRSAEEKLKAINAKFEIVEKIHREAKEYYKQSENIRTETERRAREARIKEKPSTIENDINTGANESGHDIHNKSRSAKAEETAPKDTNAKKNTAGIEVTYMAASVPRFIRQSRLGYLPLNCLIGSRLTKDTNGHNLVFDVIMLPAREFQRMKTYIGLQQNVALELKMGETFQPSFVLADTKTIMAPIDENDAERYARKHFQKLFGLEKSEEET